MIIETKFNIGDIVYFLKDNKICFEQIIKIIVRVIPNNTQKIDIKYALDDKNYTLEEQFLFHSKQELINSL